MKHARSIKNLGKRFTHILSFRENCAEFERKSCLVQNIHESIDRSEGIRVSMKTDRTVKIHMNFIEINSSYSILKAKFGETKL